MAAFTNLDIITRQGVDFVIYPFDEEYGITPVGYDLSIGCAVLLIGNNENNTQSISSTFGDTDNLEGPAITIEPNCSVFIITKEYVWLSSKVLGTLHARGSLAASGLFVNSTTIDPNWKGQLTILMRNTNSKPIQLKIGQKFLTLVLHQTLTGTISEPASDPLRVAKNYGDVYGSKLYETLSNFLLFDEINKKIKTSFDKMISTANKPTFSDYITEISNKKIPIIRNMLGNKAIEIINGSVFVLSVVMLIVSLTIQFYWSYAQNIFGFTEPYDIRVIMPQLALIVSSIVLIRGFTKKKLKQCGKA